MNALLLQAEDLINNQESIYIGITIVFWFFMRLYLVRFNQVSLFFSGSAKIQ